MEDRISTMLAAADLAETFAISLREAAAKGGRDAATLSMADALADQMSDFVGGAYLSSARLRLDPRYNALEEEIRYAAGHVRASRGTIAALEAVSAKSKDAAAYFADDLKEARKDLRKREQEYRDLVGEPFPADGG